MKNEWGDIQNIILLGVIFAQVKYKEKLTYLPSLYLFLSVTQINCFFRPSIISGIP